MRLVSAVLLLPAIIAACATDPPATEVIGPDTVSAAAVPALSSTVYQRPTIDVGLRAADSLLDILLRRQIAVVDLWAPMTTTPCASICASTNVIVSLEVPDDRIRQYGFDTSANGQCLNCGIDRFVHFHVER